MAKARKNLLSLKPTKPKKKQSRNFSFKDFGDEYEFNKLIELTSSELINAYNWYNYNETTKDSREYLKEYLIQIGDKKYNIEDIDKIPDIWFTNSIGWTARLLFNGYLVPVPTVKNMYNNLDTALTKIPTIVEQKSNVISIQNHKLDMVIGGLHKNMDDLELWKKDIKPEFDMYTWLQANPQPNYIIEKIIKTFTDLKDEFDLLLEGSDSQLNEAYEKYSKTWKKTISDFYNKICDDIDRFTGNKKKEKAPRKARAKKAVSVDKILKNIKYMKQFNELKLISINPEVILNSEELWCYNTKYKTLTIYKTPDHRKLSVKGTTLQGFDEEKSVVKNIGRKAETILDEFLKGTKRSNNKMFSDIKTTAGKPNGRINEDVILLKGY